MPSDLPKVSGCVASPQADPKPSKLASSPVPPQGRSRGFLGHLEDAAFLEWFLALNWASALGPLLIGDSVLHRMLERETKKGC